MQSDRMENNRSDSTKLNSTQSRALLEEQISAARADVDLAEQELERAEDRLTELEDELKALPPDGADEELFFARRDPRQMHLDISMGKRAHAGR